MELRGSFLIAMPHLLDPNFVRSVVLILDHGNDGAIGLVVNRPGSVPLDDLMKTLEIEWTAAPSPEVMHIGGPVQPGTIWLLHAGPETAPGSRQVREGCWFSTTREAIEELASRPTAPRRIYGGYAGWGRGQLEDELREGAWIVCEADVSLVFHHEPGEVWELALRGVGIDPMALVPGGGDVQ